MRERSARRFRPAAVGQSFVHLVQTRCVAVSIDDLVGRRETEDLVGGGASTPLALPQLALPAARIFRQHEIESGDRVGHLVRPTTQPNEVLQYQMFAYRSLDSQNF